MNSLCTLNSFLRKLWWGFDNTGYPLLLVRNRLVDTMTHLIGSASHRSNTSSSGRLVDSSRTTLILLWESHRVLNSCHLQSISHIFYNKNLWSTGTCKNVIWYNKITTPLQKFLHTLFFTFLLNNLWKSVKNQRLLSLL